MGKEEEKGARPEQKDNSSGKAPLLEPRDSVRGTASSQQDDVIDDAGSKECEHFHYDTKEMYQFLETIKGMKDDPQCVDCQHGATAENLTLQEPKPRFVMCSGCSQCFCAGLASNEDGPMGHGRLHAKSARQPVALWMDQPDAAYCFQCDHSLSLKAIALAARSHKHGYVVRRMPNFRGRCYVNSPLQCLFALDDLWMSMLGPHAPAGPIGVALKELFLETRSGNDAGANLDPRKFLDSICPLDGRYRTTYHQDCQEFLVHLCNGLIEEELQARLPDMRKDVPTVVDSIFKGEVSIMWTYKCCQHTADKDEEFYELSLPLPPKEHPTKSVPASQRRGRRKTADTVKRSRQIQKEEEKKAAASLPSIKQCLEYYFRKEDVQKRCEICEKPSTSQSKDGEQMVANISASTSLDRAQAERDHHRKVEEKNNLLSDQDRTKQVELENTAQQVGEDPSMQINMGGPADKTLSLSKLPPVLTIHVLRFNINDKRSGHVKFEENLDVGEYLDPRSGDRDNARYRLVGVIEHLGRTVKGGHFVAYVRGSRIVSEQEPSSSSSSWFRANDTDIREISLDEVLKCEALPLGFLRFNINKPGLPRPSSGHFLVTSDLPPAVARVHQQVCSKEVPDVIREIASRLPCDLAISQMACSGSSWAAALREVGFHVPGAHAKLPWLQMPHPGGPVFFCISCGGGDSVRHTIGIAEDQRWARYVSAFEGFWTVAAGTRIGRNMIFNLRSGASFPVPNQAVHGGSVQQLLLLATTLSSAPDKPNCMGMGIIKYLANLQQTRRVVFFTPGSETAIDHFPDEYFDEPEDLTYHDSSFWLLTTNEHVHRWDMALQPDGDITLEKWRGFFFPEDLDHGDHVLGRYIVPSRGEVLMVVRLSYGTGGETTKFRIYKMTVVLMGKGEDDPARCRWNELGSLAGRMLFVGRGCSRCYEASDYPWLTEGVYFCDDGHRSFNAEDIVNNLEVACSDTGRWSTQTAIDRCFPQKYDFSSYSSSGWVLQ